MLDLPVEGGVLRVRGAELACRHFGHGVPLLMLHGGAGPTPGAPYLEALAKHFEIILPTHPGFYGSPHQRHIASVDDLAYFYLDLIDDFALSELTVMGFSMGGWTKYAKHIEGAGADALELNIYFIPTDVSTPGSDVEKMYLDILHAVKSSVSIPVAVKVSPFFSNMANMAKRLDDTGANALVLFNRFYQPDVDIENLEVVPNILLSTPQAMRLPLRWTAILHGRVSCSLAVTSGIHTHEDVLKMIMVGSDVTMLCATLMKNGIKRVEEILEKMQEWMTGHGYYSVQQMKGCMSQRSCSHPDVYERAHYLKALEDYSKAIKIRSLSEL